MYLQRNLSKSLKTFKGLRFPYVSKSKSFHPHQVVIGVGGNLGDVKRRFEHLFFQMQKDVHLDIVQTSLILKNPPFGYANQDDFLNSIIVVKTSMQPIAFLDYLMRLEKKFGRTRSFANAPRTLDLDMIFFDKRVLNTKKLTLPHPSWSQRESVVIPLSGLKK